MSSVLTIENVYAVKIIHSPTQTVLSFKVEIRANGPVKYQYEYIYTFNKSFTSLAVSFLQELFYDKK